MGDPVSRVVDNITEDNTQGHPLATKCTCTYNTLKHTCTYKYEQSHACTYTQSITVHSSITSKILLNFNDIRNTQNISREENS